MKSLKVKPIKKMHETDKFFRYWIKPPMCQNPEYNCFIKTIPVKNKNVWVIFQSKK